MAVALLWCQGQAPVSIMNFQNFLLTRQRDIFVHYRNNCFLKLPRIQINFFNNNDGSCSDGIWHVLPWRKPHRTANTSFMGHSASPVLAAGVCASLKVFSAS